MLSEQPLADPLSVRRRLGFERVFVATVASLSLAMTLAHAGAGVLRNWAPSPGLFATTQVSWAMAILAAVFAVLQVTLTREKWIVWVGAGNSLVAAAFLAFLHYRLSGAVLSVLVAGSLQALLATQIAATLPAWLDGIARRRPIASVLWSLMGILLVLQMARLGSYMNDNSAPWWLAVRLEGFNDAFWSKHMCMPAYVEAADLQRQGVENIYDENYYSSLVRNAQPHLTVKNMEKYVGDAYQYPPQFLLAPDLALHWTDDFLVMRAFWYGVQVLGFVCVAILAAGLVRDEAGWSPAFLIPVLWLSLPALECFQYGQFHLAAIVMAVASLVFFEKRRDALGGLFLALSILGKIFPGILLIPLALQRRWRALGWTALFGTTITLVALGIFGLKPFQAFLGYQLPRLASGQAFDFSRQWPELREILIADNLSPFALVSKLRELGVPAMSPELAKWVIRTYGIFLVAISILGARRGASPLARLSIGLALLNLAVLQSAGAWVDYITVGSIWLLTLLGAGLRGSPWRIALLSACWIFCVLTPGLIPMPNLPSFRTMDLISIVGTLLLLGLNVWAILRNKYVRQESAVAL